MHCSEEKSRQKSEVIHEDAEFHLVPVQCDGPWKANPRNTT